MFRHDRAICLTWNFVRIVEECYGIFMKIVENAYRM